VGASRGDTIANPGTAEREVVVATKADFTQDEWEAIQKGVTGAGMLVSVSDRDFTDMFGEASALAKKLAAQREEGTSELVREIASTRGTGFGLTASPKDVEKDTLGALRTAMETLTAKAPDETESYRRLVLEIAETVAGAKGGVEPQETAALQKVREALGAA
jgi:tellurite resistance protein